MKKINKLIVIITIMLSIILISNITYGFDIVSLTGTPVDNENAKNLANTAVTVLSTIGSITSVVVLIIIGIKYMIGSIEEKAQYKKSLMPYIIGCILIFSASTIAGIVYSLVNK